MHTHTVRDRDKNIWFWPTFKVESWFAATMKSKITFLLSCGSQGLDMPTGGELSHRLNVWQQWKSPNSLQKCQSGDAGWQEDSYVWVEGQKIIKWTIYRWKNILFCRVTERTWWNLYCVLQSEGELAGTRSSPPGMRNVSAGDPEWRSVFTENIHPPLPWQQTADGSPLLIIALLACRHSVFDYHCLGDLGAITVVFASFLMAASHVEQFVFLTGVCHGALSMCKHFCPSVCRRVGVCDYR